MPMSPLTIPSVPLERVARPPLGPHGLLCRRRTVPDANGPYRTSWPPRAPRAADRAPQQPFRPLPSGLLPLPTGFELNREQFATVVSAQATSVRQSGASAI